MKMKSGKTWKALSTMPAWHLETTQSMTVIIIRSQEKYQKENGDSLYMKELKFILFVFFCVFQIFYNENILFL